MVVGNIRSTLAAGDRIAVVSPSSPIEVLSQECVDIAVARLGSIGIETELHHGIDSIDERVRELHEAYKDKSINGLMSSVGGLRTNQLLSYIDWELVAKNPKPFIGFSDITVLLNAILARTGIITYLGPHFSTFGQLQFDDYTSHSFESVVMNPAGSFVEESREWTDDLWYQDQGNRNPLPNEGMWSIQIGHESGVVIGGNLCSMNLLQGTEYWPEIDRPIVLVEDTAASGIGTFDRDLQSLLHAQDLAGLIIGRFQKGSEISRHILEELIGDKQELRGVPVIANVDIGHTLPIASLPIGGVVELDVSQSKSSIKICGL